MIINTFDTNPYPLHTNDTITFNQKFIFVTNFVIYICYFIEIIAKGFLICEGAFCRDIWRLTDFINLTSFILSNFITLPILNAFKLLSI